MEKNITVFAGLDVSDKYSNLCVLNEDGEVEEQSRIRTRGEAFKRYFKGKERMRIVLEVGTHSRWISKELKEMGHEVIVANARKLRLIYENDRKSDDTDAQMLARIGRLDPKLLYPIEHRDEESHVTLALIKARDVLVQSRTKMVNHVRGAVKAMGHFLPKCSTESFYKHKEEIPEKLKPALLPLMEEIRRLTALIRQYDKQIKKICEQKYPETQQLQQVKGVGPVTSLAFVLTLEDPERFETARDVGAYVGLIPKKGQSGENDPQLRITKAGNKHMRRLLAGSAQYILGPFGPDTDLRRWGKKLMARGGKRAKRKAVIAVARKLAVLLYRLWQTGERYEPLRQQKGKAVVAAVA